MAFARQRVAGPWPGWLVGLLGLVVLLLARAGHATLIHAHNEQGAHVHLLTAARATPGAFAAWHAHHGGGSAADETGEEHVHGTDEHGAGLLLAPLFVLVPLLGGGPRVPPPASELLTRPEAPRTLAAFTAASAARERDPPTGRAHSGLAAVLLRNHSIRI